jgi:Uma2 family endonuclease
MSTAPDHRRVSFAEYLVWEERSETKHEYYRGEIFAMAGATANHNRISGNIYAYLHGALEGKPCEPFGSDMRLRIDAVDLSTYPDVSVVCGGLKMDSVDKNAIVNPRVIFEVLSESTKNYDTGQKFEFYQRLESLTEYILVEQSEAKAIQYIRQGDGTWEYRLIVGKDSLLVLDSIGCEIPLKSISQRRV